VQWLGHLLPPVADLLQGFMCVCTQVSCSVVSNWPLCEFCGRVYCDILSIIFNSLILFVFLRHQTMDKVQKHNSFITNTPSSESYRNYSELFVKSSGVSRYYDRSETQARVSFYGFHNSTARGNKLRKWNIILPHNMESSNIILTYYFFLFNDACSLYWLYNAVRELKRLEGSRLCTFYTDSVLGCGHWGQPRNTSANQLVSWGRFEQDTSRMRGGVAKH
jgi:hypothetical protein